jgi:hypothetical protein
MGVLARQQACAVDIVDTARPHYRYAFSLRIYFNAHTGFTLFFLLAFSVALAVLAGRKIRLVTWIAGPSYVGILIGYIPFLMTNIASTALMFFKAWSVN